MNRFIASLGAGAPKIGFFLSLASSYSAEACAHAGFDWLLVESEHAPNDHQTLLAQAQALAAFNVHMIARPPCQEARVIKQFLDLGFDTLLIPMVESAEQARDIVAATRFPPKGVRGYAGMTSRASAFGEDTRYFAEADDRVGVIIQIENRKGLAALDEIAAVDGVDAIFFGPGDLAADMGHLGNSGAAPVQEAISAAIPRVRAAGKPCGIFALGADDAARRAGEGVSFMAVGVDLGVLISGAKRLNADVREKIAQHKPSPA